MVSARESWYAHHSTPDNKQVKNNANTTYQLYKSYSNIEFLQLMHYEREQRSLSQLLLTGLPPFLVMQGIHWTRLSVDWVLERRWYVIDEPSPMGFILTSI